MEQHDQTALNSLVQAMEEATDLATAGRYGELAERAETLEAEASRLEALKPALRSGVLEASEVGDQCRLLQRKAFALGSVLQHIRMVQSGLLEIGRAAQGGYGPDGHCHADGQERIRVEG